MAQPISKRNTKLKSGGSFLHISFNRPDTGNMMQSEDLSLITDHVQSVSADSDTRAVMISGKGEHFTLGRDPGNKGGRKPAAPKTAWQVHEQITSQILGVYAAIRHCPVPVIAKVQGHAQGFGAGLVGACDLAYAADSAIFSTPEMRHGIAPTLVISALANIHPKAYADMVYSGDPIDASTALGAGLISRVVAADELDAAVEEFLERLGGYDRLAVQVIKKFLSKPGHMDPDTLSDLADFTLSTAFTRPRD